MKCIKLLLQLAASHGRYFRLSWKYILEIISKIDFYLNYSPSQGRDIDYSGESPRNVKPEVSDPLDQINSDVIKSIVDPNTINHIFNDSGVYNLEEIMDFITCLCQISEYIDLTKLYTN